MARAKKVNSGAKLVAAISAEQQRHRDAVSGINEAARIRASEIEEAIADLLHEGQLLETVQAST